MNTKIKARLIRIGILSAIVLIIGGGLSWYQQTQFPDGSFRIHGRPTSGSTPIAGAAQIGGPFELVNQDGQTVTEENFSGDYKLIYFGFTYCPAICPTELQKMTKVMNALGEEGEKIQPLFISVDPERDTPEVMKQYVSLFHTRLIGLTGNLAQIQKVKKDYRIFARKVDDPEMSDYTVDHSSFIYLMSPANELISIYKMDDAPETITRDIRGHLE